MVDLPGYGHAVATQHAMKDWNVMIRDYLTNRHVISRFYFQLHIYECLHLYMQYLELVFWWTAVEDYVTEIEH